jgi:hypothetical protein
MSTQRTVIEAQHRPTAHKNVKQSRYTPCRSLGGEVIYSSYSLTASALEGGEWSASRTGRALPPRKGPAVPTVQEAPESAWTQRLEEKFFAPAGDLTPIARASSPWPHTTLTELPRLLNCKQTNRKNQQSTET